ncbi:hypothetical protein COL940_000811 [Colletotrichum noveboracense]|nr:hypothetical protein COL940_000811 [Colletotrichum noveboracense]
MHHFETLPARRNNHMEVSYVGAKDLYHATATSIANSERKKAAVSSRASTESGRDSIVPPKNRLSFATKVLQSGRKRPPTGINTTTQSQSPSPPGPMTGSGRLTAGSRPDMHAHSMDDDRLRVERRAPEGGLRGHITGRWAGSGTPNRGDAHHREDGVIHVILRYRVARDGGQLAEQDGQAFGAEPRGPRQEDGKRDGAVQG